MRSFKSGYRRHLETSWANIVDKLTWMWEFASDMQEAYSCQTSFLRCGYKFDRFWDGHYRRDMSSALLKFLHDGDEGAMNTEQAYAQGDTKCCLDIMWPDVAGRYDSETEDDWELALGPLAGGQSQSQMFLPRAVDGTRLAIPSTIAPSLSADGGSQVVSSAGTFGFTSLTQPSQNAAAPAAATSSSSSSSRNVPTSTVTSAQPTAKSRGELPCVGSADGASTTAGTAAASSTSVSSRARSSSSPSTGSTATTEANRDKWMDEGAAFFHPFDEEELSDVPYEEDDLFEGGEESVLEADPDWVPRPGDEID